MKKKPLSKYPLVHIHWHDAAMHGNGQVSVEEARNYGIMKGHVAGWLVNETKRDVTIAMDFFPAQTNNENDTFRTLQSYPKSGIERMTKVKVLEVYKKEPPRNKPSKK